MANGPAKKAANNQVMIEDVESEFIITLTEPYCRSNSLNLRN